MFIGEISKTIRREVVYPYLDKNGDFQESKFYIWIKRLSFREQTTKAFKEQFKSIEQDESKLADTTAPLIDKWDLFNKPLPPNATEEEKDAARIAVSADILKDQDSVFVSKIAETVFTALGEASDPKAKPANSADGSEQKAVQASQATTS